jgi:uroporphyrinogen-III synthase
MALNGLRVIAFESRRAVEIGVLIEKQGGVPFVAPSVRELPPADPSEALRFADRIELGEFEMIVFMTGVGLRLFLQSIAPAFDAARLATALKRLTVVSRGPKPAAVLREMNVPVTIAIPEPNTWREIVAALGRRDERKVGVLDHGRSNPELIKALNGFDMTVSTYAPYQWELPEDLGPLREAVRRLAADPVECDVAVFTSSVQIEHLLEVARASGEEAAVKRALTKHVAVASIGPAMTEALQEAGLAPDIVPQHPKMGMLLAAVGALAGPIVQAKRM